jgi:hypothetical protein
MGLFDKLQNAFGSKPQPVVIPKQRLRLTVEQAADIAAKSNYTLKDVKKEGFIIIYSGPKMAWSDDDQCFVLYDIPQSKPVEDDLELVGPEGDDGPKLVWSEEKQCMIVVEGPDAK